MTNEQRAEQVSRELKSRIDQDDRETAVRDVLSDLRHFCDVYAIDFGEQDRVARNNYVYELDNCEQMAEPES